jgi:SAM-dependent methyltransferase
MRLAQASSVLDLPCGTGRHSLFLGKIGHFITISDINATLVHETAERLRLEGVKCNGVATDATKLLPFKRASFDLVVITDFVDEYLLSSIGCFLRMGGYLIYESYAAKGGNWLQLLPPGRTDEVLKPMFEVLRREQKCAGPNGAEAESIKLLARRI